MNESKKNQNRYFVLWNVHDYSIFTVFVAHDSSAKSLWKCEFQAFLYVVSWKYLLSSYSQKCKSANLTHCEIVTGAWNPENICKGKYRLKLDCDICDAQVVKYILC